MAATTTNNSSSLADLGTLIGGIGSLAGAWGAYENSKTQNKLLKDKVKYQKSLDDRAIKKEDAFQDNLDNAFAPVPKKKKQKLDANGVPIPDYTMTA